MIIEDGKVKKYDRHGNEIPLLRKCDHANIVKLLRVEGSYFYIPYSRHGDLLDWILEEKCTDESQRRFIIRQICHALEYLESKGIIHRDVKPENIIILEDSLYPRIQLIDFGLAFERKEGSTQVCGTANYLPPEGFRGEYSHKTDMWGVGAILFALYTVCLFINCRSGIPEPFESKEVYEEYKAHALLMVERKSGRKFISLLLSWFPEERPGARDALRGKWLRRKHS